jgi:hypothetical protein
MMNGRVIDRVKEIRRVEWKMKASIQERLAGVNVHFKSTRWKHDERGEEKRKKEKWQ